MAMRDAPRDCVECGDPIAVDFVGQTRYCDDCLAALREPAAEEGRE